MGSVRATSAELEDSWTSAELEDFEDFLDELEELFDFVELEELLDFFELEECFDFPELEDSSTAEELDERASFLLEDETLALLEELLISSAELEEVVARCVELKAQVVSQDEHDNGLRQLLNYLILVYQY